MTVQPTSRFEINQFGDFAVRVVCGKMIAPATDTMERLQSKFEAEVAFASEDGHGRVAYVLCGSMKQKRQAQLAVAGESGIEELIDNYRRWVALHSYIYYGLGTTVVSDDTWDRKARKLARLQRTHGLGTWQSEAFEGFTGDTGFHLPVTDEIRKEAESLAEE